MQKPSFLIVYTVNLLMYLQLANKAFTAAQSLDPGYAAAWIGQATIAHSIGHADCMDLYRHTTELDYHVSHWLLYKASIIRVGGHDKGCQWPGHDTGFQCVFIVFGESAECMISVAYMYSSMCRV